jgi:prevent-host-death family protein
METVGIRELKQNASEVIAKVARGKWLLVTDRGRPVAQLIPLQKSRIDDLIESGQLQPASKSLDDLPAPMKAPKGMSLAQAIIDDRNQD